MTDLLAALIADALPGLQLGATGQDAGNRFSLEGLAIAPRANGAHEFRIRKLEATALKLAAGAFVLEVERLALHQLAAQVHGAGGRPRLASLQAASAQLQGVKIRGPVNLPARGGKAGSGAWSLAPLAAAEGTIRATIVDAHLLFDADVAVPVRRGRIAFGDATVEHVGPDSRMGVSRLGLYVDAPNGRSYLYQFSAAPVAGVEYEQRGALLGRVSERGSLQLQPFLEALLQQEAAGADAGFTAQTRQLLGRTSVSGDLRLGDGKFAAPGVQVELMGRAEGRNAIHIHSEAVGRGLSAEIRLLSLRNAVLALGARQLECAEITGALTLGLAVEGTQLRFALELPNLEIAGLAIDGAPHPAG